MSAAQMQLFSEAADRRSSEFGTAPGSAASDWEDDDFTYEGPTCGLCGDDGWIMLSDAGPSEWGEDCFCDIDRPIECPKCRAHRRHEAPRPASATCQMKTKATIKPETALRSEPAVRWSACFGGWLVRGDYDREGYWITDKAGYRNTLTASLTRITDPSGQVARRIVLWRFMLEWAKPQNEKVRDAPDSAAPNRE